MKKGLFFPIPESPRDLDELRQQSAQVDACPCPSWLAGVPVDYYLHVGRFTCGGLDDDQRKQCAAEIMELQMAGLIVDADSRNPDVQNVFIRSASDYDIWSIGIYRGRSPWTLRPAGGVTNPVLTRDDVTDVSAVLVADPFMIQEHGAWHMFFEILNWRSNKGEIGWATSDDGLRWHYQQRVLIEPFHLSYPYVFQEGGTYYMVPESRQSHSIRLYRAIDFPARWQFVGNLLDGHDLVDASVFFAHGRWRLLACGGSAKQHDILRLYGADSLTGPWREHPSSPVINGNPHRARPAGRVLVEDSRIYRFAQDCSPFYGMNVRAFEITELTEETYREVDCSVQPILGPSGIGWNAGGMHHVDAHQLEDGSWLACVDGWRRATES